MKKLYLLRHAEAEKKAGQTDHERALTSFGIMQAEQLGMHMKNDSIIPDLVLCSDAARARQTFESLNKALELPTQALVYEHNLYNSPAEELESQILNVSDSVNSLMLIAHNPGITSLPLRFQLLGETPGLDDFNPTCKFVALRLETTSWSNLLTAKCRVVEIFFP